MPIFLRGYYPECIPVVSFGGILAAISSYAILPVELLCRSREKRIAVAVEGGFDGVLNDTDDGQDCPRPLAFVRSR